MCSDRVGVNRLSDECGDLLGFHGGHITAVKVTCQDPGIEAPTRIDLVAVFFKENALGLGFVPLLLSTRLSLLAALFPLLLRPRQ